MERRLRRVTRDTRSPGYVPLRCAPKTRVTTCAEDESARWCHVTPPVHFGSTFLGAGFPQDFWLQLSVIICKVASLLGSFSCIVSRTN